MWGEGNRVGAGGVDDGEAAVWAEGAGGAEGGVHEVGAVALAAEVGKENLLQSVAFEGHEQFQGEVVGEVTVASADALFETHGAGGTGEQVGVVIGFEDEEIDIADFLADQLGHVAKVGDPSEFPARRKQIVLAEGESVADRIGGVVRDGEITDGEVLKLEGGTGVENLPTQGGFGAGLGGAGGFLVGEETGLVETGQPGESGDVVGVLVGDEDCVEVFDPLADGGEALLDASRGKSCVDQNTAVRRDEQGGVASAAAAENVKAKIHLGAARCPGRGNGQTFWERGKGKLRIKSYELRVGAGCEFPLSGFLVAVAHTVDGEDGGGGVGLRFDFFPQLRDVLVEGASGAEVIDAPDRVE